MKKQKFNRKRDFVEVAGVKIVLFGSRDYNDLVIAIAEEGEDVSGAPYIILSKEPILPDKKLEVRKWYKQYIDDLVVKGQSPKRSVRKRARKSLKQLGWSVNWADLTKKF